MKFLPCGFGGKRRSAEQIKRDGWREQNILVVSAEDQRFSSPKRELVRQLGEKLYGKDRAGEARHG